jgi:hypothetical protein
MLLPRPPSPPLSNPPLFAYLFSVSLAKIGIRTQGSEGYGSKFGISLTPRQPIEIIPGAKPLMAGELGDMALPEGQAPLLNGMLIDQEGMMWFVDLPMDLPDQPAIYMAADGYGYTSKEAPTLKFGFCSAINRPLGISPTGKATILYHQYVDQLFSFRYKDKVLRTDTVVTPIYAPNHGELIEKNNGDFMYIPAPDFYGMDTFIFEVKAGDVVVWIYYYMSVGLPGEPTYVMDEKGERDNDVTRCPQESWIFTQPPSPRKR